MLYSKRLANFVGVDEETINQHLPSSREEYEYYSNAPEDLRGWTGYFKNEQEISAFTNVLQRPAGIAAAAD